MTYDPYKDYLERERRHRRWDGLLPVLVAAVVLLVAFYAFFCAYQRSHEAHIFIVPYTKLAPSK